MQPNQVFDADGQQIGTYRETMQMKESDMILVFRDERLGGGTIVLSAREAGAPDDPWRLPYGELTIREAPPYSPNVPLRAYYDYWERLGANDSNLSATAYVPTGSGTLQTNGVVPDNLLREAISDSLLSDSSGNINNDLIDLTVHDGTVLLEGYQNDTQGRLAAAQAAESVPGVKEIVNMLVIRAL